MLDGYVDFTAGRDETVVMLVAASELDRRIAYGIRRGHVFFWDTFDRGSCVKEG
jgi:hypothetical protein